MDRSRLKRLISFLSLFVVCFLLALMAIFGSLFFMKYFSQTTDDLVVEDVYKYQELTFNARTNSTNFGISTLSEPISGDFLSYEDGNGKYVLHSNFGDTEYQCTGQCFCEEEEGRRRSSILSSGGILRYLLVALSVPIAYKLSKEHFERECEKEFSESPSCSMGRITSKIFGCDPVVEKETAEKEVSKNPRYLCEGHCIGNIVWYENHEIYSEEDLRGEPLTAMQQAKELSNKHCGEVKLTLEIVYKDKDMKRTPQDVFGKDYLQSLCDNFNRMYLISTQDLPPEEQAIVEKCATEQKKKKKAEKLYKKYEKVFPFEMLDDCMWKVCTWGVEGKANDHLKCRKLEPKIQPRE